MAAELTLQSVQVGPEASERTGATTSTTRIGLVALAMAIGLLIVSYADGLARTRHVSGAYALLWVGLICVFAPAVVHAWRAPDRTETVAVVVLLGIALYMVKVLDSPLHFTDHDEFSTLRVALDIRQLGSPFHHDPLITIHPFFPGLELVTVAVSSLTGLSLFVSALIVIGVMRVVMMLALFALFESTATWRIAALATVLYAANPNFVFFNAQWAYESFSLPLALAAVALIARAPWSRWSLRIQAAVGKLSLRSLALPVLLVVTVSVSHPLTSYALILFLLAWATAYAVMAIRSGMSQRPELWVLSVALVALTAAWTALVGGVAGGYFGPVLGKAGSSAIDLLFGGSAPKHLFSAPGVPPTPTAERLVAYGSVGLALLVLPLGLIWLRKRLTPLRATLAVVALLYIPSLPLRLTQAGTEISNRASEFVYVGIALLGALVLKTEWRIWRAFRLPFRRTISTAMVVALAAIMFAGGIVIGWARYLRVPGPYLVVADERSVEPEGIAAARWARQHLGPGHRILVDRANGLLMGSIGGQDPVGGTFLGRSVPAVLLGPEFTGTDYYVLVKDRVGYVVVDKRLATALPLVGVYVENDEPGAYDHTTPPTVSGLLKYRGICPIPLEFDSGNIFIFNTGLLDRSYCLTKDTGPHHYGRFYAGPFRFRGAVLHERAIVERFDQLMQNPVANASKLFALRQRIELLRNRIAFVATHENGGWGRWSRRWRWQELDDRLL